MLYFLRFLRVDEQKLKNLIQVANLLFKDVPRNQSGRVFVELLVTNFHWKEAQNVSRVRIFMPINRLQHKGYAVPLNSLIHLLCNLHPGFFVENEELLWERTVENVEHAHHTLVMTIFDARCEVDRHLPHNVLRLVP